MLIWNAGTSTIPAYGIGMLTNPGEKILDNNRRAVRVTDVAMPSESTAHTWLFINDSAPLLSGKSCEGRFVWERPLGLVAYEESDGTPAYGEMWGIQNAEFKLRKSEPGFEIVGEPHNGRVLAMFLPTIKFYVRLTEDLEAADPDLETGEKTAQARVLRPFGGSPNLTVTAREIEVTNRWLDVELDAQKKLWVEWSWLYLEWVPVAGECP